MSTDMRTGWFTSMEKADALASHLFHRNYGTRITPCGPWTLLEFWRKSK